MNNRNTRRDNIISNALTGLGVFGQIGQNYLTEDETAEMLAKLNKCAKEYCKLDLKNNDMLKCVQMTEDHFSKLGDNDSHEVPVQTIFDNSVEANCKDPSEEVIQNHPYMVKFHQEIYNVEEESSKSMTEDGIIASKAFEPPIDPITKTVIRNPVKNSQCGHIYENESIQAMILKKNTRCPYIGCPAIQYIQPEYLITENTLKRKIDMYFLNM